MVCRLGRSILPLLVIVGSYGCGSTRQPGPGDPSTTGTPLPSDVDYVAVIQPIFDAHCTQCHNDVNKAAGLFAGLSLASYEQAISGGFSGALVVPGNPDGSLLVAMISGVVPGRSRMPFDDPTYFDTPDGRRGLLLIQAWIAEGAGPGLSSSADDGGDRPVADDAASIGEDIESDVVGDAEWFRGAIAAHAIGFDPETGTGSALLTWAPPTDETGEPEDGVVYNIFESTESPVTGFANPTYTVTNGATEFELAGLLPDQFYFYVVRADDGSGRRDQNTIEVSLRLGVDYRTQVSEPILTQLCTMCHGGDTPQNNVSFETYQGTVGSEGLQGGGEVEPFDGEGSVIYQKTGPAPPFGSRMPLTDPTYFDANSDARERIRRWIDQGALELPDVAPPSFGGAVKATANAATAIVVEWVEADDDAAQPGYPAPIRYNVYASTRSGEHGFRTPTARAPEGATEITLTGLTPDTDYFIVVRAVDPSGNEDDNTTEVVARTKAPPMESEPPTFAGAESATASGPDSITLAWTEATDNATPSSLIVYDVYRALASGEQDFANEPAFTTSAGAATFDDTTVETTTTYYYVVRARDEAGNRDENTVEVSATTAEADAVPPAFAGLTSATASGDSSITLAWAAATDNVTAADAIAYVVFQAASSGAQVFGIPTYTTGPGVTSFEATGLSADTTYYFVVRARDEAGNEDDNTVERLATTEALPLGAFVRDPTMEQVCSQCHGVRMVLDDGSVGEVTPPGQGLAFFPPGFFMDCDVRSGQAWQDTVSRMRNQNGCPMTDAEEEQIVTFLSANYTGGDPRAATFTRVCSVCHTPSVTGWVPRSPVDWERTVDRMIDRYEAPVTSQERTDIIGYLGEAAAGEPPAELAEPEARIYMNLVCSTCHSPKRVLDKDTGLPDSHYRDFEDALKLTRKMMRKGCGLQGTTDVIIARWLSSVQSPTPDLVNIDRYRYRLADGDLEVRAWSSTGGPGALTLHGDGALQVVMPYEGNGEYRLRLQGVDIFPGRITITSTDGGSLRWHRRLDDAVD